MLLKLDYSHATGPAARGQVEGKAVNFFMRVRVTEENLAQAVEKFRGNRHVVSLDYEGSPDFLQTLDLSGVLVVVTKEVPTLDMNVGFLVSQYPSNIRLVLQLPETFSDMRLVETYCEKYPNVHVSGGQFIRLPGCRIGAILQGDLYKKIPENRISLVVSGEGSLMSEIYIDDADEVEFYTPKLVVEKKPKTPGKAKSTTSKTTKKPLASLLQLGATAGAVDNF